MPQASNINPPTPIQQTHHGKNKLFIDFKFKIEPKYICFYENGWLSIFYSHFGSASEKFRLDQFNQSSQFEA